jgi:hypothetical protein
MKYTMKQDERLGLARPVLLTPYDQLNTEEQASFELLCQSVCARIPETIKQFELKYMENFEALEWVDEEKFYQLMSEMNEISSCICDLNLLFLWIEGNFQAKSLHA